MVYITEFLAQNGIHDHAVVHRFFVAGQQVPVKVIIKEILMCSLNKLFAYLYTTTELWLAFLVWFPAHFWWAVPTTRSGLGTRLSLLAFAVIISDWPWVPIRSDPLPGGDTGGECA